MKHLRQKCFWTRPSFWDYYFFMEWFNRTETRSSRWIDCTKEKYQLIVVLFHHSLSKQLYIHETSQRSTRDAEEKLRIVAALCRVRKLYGEILPLSFRFLKQKSPVRTWKTAAWERGSDRSKEVKSDDEIPIIRQLVSDESITWSHWLSVPSQETADGVPLHCISFAVLALI